MKSLVSGVCIGNAICKYTCLLAIAELLSNECNWITTNIFFNYMLIVWE